jgi:predicted aconitase
MKMTLADDEKRILDGEEGRARQVAMDLLVRYGEALGAERLVDTMNVAGGVVGTLPNRRDVVPDPTDMDAVYSLLNLDSDEKLEIPPVKANTYKLIEAMDPEHWEMQRVSEATRNLVERNEAFCSRLGINRCNTCTPYQVGNVPVFGEHCAWMESSAVIYINALLGARTNVEGAQSTAAASLVGKIPYWGLHIADNRKATHHIHVETPVDDMMDWGLLGYWIGEEVQEAIPVLTGDMKTGELRKMKHFGAAAATSGGVEMYHIPGLTPEAQSLDHALGHRTPEVELVFGESERRAAHAHLNCATTDDVDFMMLGCPHNSLDQIRLIARHLDGRKVSANTALWIFTPNAIRAVADRMGYTKILQDAGAVLMTDSCPALSRVTPADVKTVATDSCKQAHYLPATHGYGVWFGTVEDCLDSAVAGKWVGARP